MKFYKYHGAGNDFLLYDAREDGAVFTPSRVASLCDRHLGIGSDGLMVLSEAPGYDFRMEFFNPDGSGGMMCGNGGRCIVAFARDLGIEPQAPPAPAACCAGAEDSAACCTAAAEPSAVKCYRFLAPDGPHTAWLISDDGPVKTIRLGMKPVTEYYAVTPVPGISSGWFVDTGTRHFVTFVPSVRDVDVDGLGRQIRHLPQFAPAGVNVNFVELTAPGEIAVRTFEKGVEGETLACGTGITASAIAAWLAACPQDAPAIAALASRPQDASAAPAAGPVIHAGSAPETVRVHARLHDLTVTFSPAVHPDPIRKLSFSGVTLTGPAERVATIYI